MTFVLGEPAYAANDKTRSKAQLFSDPSAISLRCVERFEIKAIRDDLDIVDSQPFVRFHIAFYGLRWNHNTIRGSSQPAIYLDV